MCRMSAWENSRSSSFEGLVEKPIKREIDNVPELRLKNWSAEIGFSDMWAEREYGGAWRWEF